MHADGRLGLSNAQANPLKPPVHEDIVSQSIKIMSNTSVRQTLHESYGEAPDRSHELPPRLSAGQTVDVDDGPPLKKSKTSKVLPALTLIILYLTPDFSSNLLSKKIFLFPSLPFPFSFRYLFRYLFWEGTRSPDSSLLVLAYPPPPYFFPCPLPKAQPRNLFNKFMLW